MTRPLPTVALLLACAILAPIAAAADRAPSKLGFLFDMRDAKCGMGNLCFPEFNTTLLVIDGDKMRVAVSSPHFYVPRKNGFWELGTTLPGTLAGTRLQTKQQDAEDDSSAEFVWQLWAAPLGTRPALSLPRPPKDPTAPEQPEEPSDDSDELKSLQLTWAGTDYLSVDEQIGEYATRHLILRLDDVGSNLDDSPWMPKLSAAVVRKDVENCVAEKSDFNTHAFLDDAAQAWSITRGRMRWEFQWTFSHDGRALRGYEAACSPSVHPPGELVGSDTLGVGWNQVLAKVPDAQTAFATPDRSLLLVFTNTQILALRREGEVLGAPFARVFLQTTEVLSAQWAIGRYADEWAAQLSQAQSWTDLNQPANKH
ncbi:MAG: hypothetical protein WB762_03965 [Candidatus Sulfotelmatobacter sp.]